SASVSSGDESQNRSISASRHASSKNDASSAVHRRRVMSPSDNSSRPRISLSVCTEIPIHWTIASLLSLDAGRSRGRRTTRAVQRLPRRHGRGPHLDRAVSRDIEVHVWTGRRARDRSDLAIRVAVRRGLLLVGGGPHPSAVRGGAYVVRLQECTNG